VSIYKCDEVLLFSDNIYSLFNNCKTIDDLTMCHDHLVMEVDFDDYKYINLIKSILEKGRKPKLDQLFLA
jgi:hypothetical protein